MNKSSISKNIQPKIELNEGEQIIWQGQPNPKVVRLKEVIQYIFGLIFFIILLPMPILFWYSNKNYEGWADFSHTAKIIVFAIQICIVLPFMLIGLYWASKSFFDYQRKKRTWFVLTNRRATVVYTGAKPSERSCALVKPLKITKLAGSAGKGLIIFDEVPDRLLQQRLASITPIKGEIFGTLVFFDINALDEVDRLIESCISENSSQIVADPTNTKQCNELIEGSTERLSAQTGLMSEISKLNKRLIMGSFLLLALTFGLFWFMIYQVNHVAPHADTLTKPLN